MSMQTRKAHSDSSILRAVLTKAWDLNVKAIPTSIVWAVSLMFIFQSSSLLTRLVCGVICSVVSLFNCTIVKFSQKHIKPLQLIKAPQFQKFASMNVLVGILFVFALSNLLNLQSPIIWISVSLKSTALSLFIAWMGLMLIVNPLFVCQARTQESHSVSQIFMVYVKRNKKAVALTGVIVLACAPLIFVFISLSLTLTQGLTVITFEEMQRIEV